MDDKVVGDTKPSSPSSSRHSRGKRYSSTCERDEEKSKHHEEDAESRDGRTKRREKEDRDSKRKSRFIDAAIPGAHTSTAEHRSNEKSSKRPGDDSKVHRRSSHHRSSRSPKRGSRPSNEKSGHRSSCGPATIPGAQVEPISPRRSRRGDDKGKERRGSRATKPGAASPTRDRSSKTKPSASSRNSNILANVSPLSDSARSSVPSEGLLDTCTPLSESGRSTVADSDGLPHVGEDGDPTAIVSAKKNRSISSNEQARIEEMLAAERQRNDAEKNQRLRDELDRLEAERTEKERKVKKRKVKKREAKKHNRTMCLVLVLVGLVLVLIGAGIVAFFALRGGRSSDSRVNNPDKDGKQQTVDPSAIPSTSPSSDISSVPTGAPTVPLKYPPLSELECQRIASDLSIDGENEMFDRSFAISMEVDLLEGNDIDPQVPELESQIRKLLVPDLIGCDRDLFNKRRLGHHDQSAGINNGSMAKSAHHRQLQSARIRYAIAKAIVTVTVTGNACGKSASPNCSVVTANLDLKIRGEEKVIFLAGVIGEIFPNGVDIRPDLELGIPFEAVVIGIIRSLDPTPAPSIAPTGIASENPSGAPSASPTLSPTTSSPSKTPSKAPAPPPTIAPTVAPQPGPSPAPTPLPTKSPTTVPSKSPTRSPTRNPSKAPSPSPSIQASSAPSLAPTKGPTSSPATPAPTSIYLGCFRDESANRVMDVNAGETFDVEGCREYCRNTGYPYSALQAGAQCFCGNNYDSLGTASNCDSACDDPNDLYCGGMDANSAYMSGAPSTSSVPALESDLYCGCFADLSFIARDLPHISPYFHLSQVGCINYCRSQGYAFAGLQFNSQCFCGDDAGSYGTSLNCFTVDKDRDGNPDVCLNSGAGACYDGSNSCSCGGGDANLLFRIDQTVSCPAQIPPTQDFLGCFVDDISRDLNVFGMKGAINVEMCREFCRDIGFAYSSVQVHHVCFCGNSYANTISTPTSCTAWWRNAVYWSGAAIDQVSDLDEDLHCGCFADSTSQRVSEYLAPYDVDIGQKGCIHYCRSQGYDYAGIRDHKCFCRANPESYSTSRNCNTRCVLWSAACCLDGSENCSVGGSVGSDLFQDMFRTRRDVPCP